MRQRRRCTLPAPPDASIQLAMRLRLPLRHTLRLAAALLLPLPLLGACLLAREPTALDRGSIYYRVIQESNCQSQAYTYRDDRQGFSPGAHMTDYIGPVLPGTFGASYYRNNVKATFTWVLADPPRGHRRYYTQLITKATYAGCLDVSNDPAFLTVVDEPAP